MTGPPRSRRSGWRRTVRTSAIPTTPARPGTISSEQVHRLWALAAQRRWQPDDVRNWLVGTYAVSSSSDILAVNYDAILAHLEAGPVPVPVPIALAFCTSISSCRAGRATGSRSTPKPASHIQSRTTRRRSPTRGALRFARARSADGARRSTRRPDAGHVSRSILHRQVHRAVRTAGQLE